MQSQQELRQVALCVALACRSEGHTVMRLLEDATRITNWLSGVEVPQVNYHTAAGTQKEPYTSTDAYYGDKGFPKDTFWNR